MEYRTRPAVLGVLVLALAAVLHLVGPHGFGASAHHAAAPETGHLSVAAGHVQHEHGAPTTDPQVVDYVSGHAAHADVHAECWIRPNDAADDHELPVPSLCATADRSAARPHVMPVRSGCPPGSLAFASVDVVADLGISRT